MASPENSIRSEQKRIAKEAGEGPRAGFLHTQAIDDLVRRFGTHLTRTIPAVPATATSPAIPRTIMRTIPAIPPSASLPSGRPEITLEQDLRDRLRDIFNMTQESQATSDPTAPNRNKMINDLVRDYQAQATAAGVNLRAFIGNRLDTDEFNKWMADNPEAYQQYQQKHGKFVNALVKKASEMGYGEFQRTMVTGTPWKTILTGTAPLTYVYGALAQPLIEKGKEGYVPVGRSRSAWNPHRFMFPTIPDSGTNSDWKAMEMRMRLWKILTSQPGERRRNAINNLVDDYYREMPGRIIFRSRFLRKALQKYVGAPDFKPFVAAQKTEGTQDGGQGASVDSQASSSEQPLSLDVQYALNQMKIEYEVASLIRDQEDLLMLSRQHGLPTANIEARLAQLQRIQQQLDAESDLDSVDGIEGREATPQMQAVNDMFDVNTAKIVASKNGQFGVTEEWLRERDTRWGYIKAGLRAAKVGSAQGAIAGTAAVATAAGGVALGGWGSSLTAPLLATTGAFTIPGAALLSTPLAAAIAVGGLSYLLLNRYGFKNYRRQEEAYKHMKDLDEQKARADAESGKLKEMAESYNGVA